MKLSYQLLLVVLLSSIPLSGCLEVSEDDINTPSSDWDITDSETDSGKIDTSKIKDTDSIYKSKEMNTDNNDTVPQDSIPSRDTDYGTDPHCWSADEIPEDATDPTCPSNIDHELAIETGFDNCCGCLSDEFIEYGVVFEGNDWDNGYCCGDCTAICGPWKGSCSKWNRRKGEGF